MTGAWLIATLIVVLLLIILIILSKKENFVGAGMTGLGENPALGYNSGASLREQSLAEDLQGDYIKTYEKNEGKFLQDRAHLARFNWNSIKAERDDVPIAT
jgi:hypothetical protein